MQCVKRVRRFLLFPINKFMILPADYHCFLNDTPFFFSVCCGNKRTLASSQLYAHLGKDYSNRLISYALQLHMLCDKYNIQLQWIRYQGATVQLFCFWLCFQIYIKQNRIKLILDGKKIPYEEIDLSKNQEVREEMRALAGIPDLLPPQIFNGNTYCGVRVIAVRTRVLRVKKWRSMTLHNLSFISSFH